MSQGRVVGRFTVHAAESDALRGNRKAALAPRWKVAASVPAAGGNIQLNITRDIENTVICLVLPRLRLDLRRWFV